MTENKFVRAFIIFILVISFFSCEKQDDYSKLSYNYPYHPNFSFAIGNSFMNLIVMGKDLPWNWQNNPSLLHLPDTLLLDDRLPFEVSSWSKQGIEKISQITIKIRGYNEFPARVHLNFLLEDSVETSKKLTDFIISESIFKSDSIPEIKGYFETYITLTKEKIMQLSSIKYLHIIAIIENKIKQDDIYAYYKNLKISVGIGVQVQFDFNLQDI